MSSKTRTSVKLLPRKDIPDADKEGSPANAVRHPHLYNFGLALLTTVLLAFVLLPRTPRLEKGEIAPRDIVAPYTMYIEYQGPDQTVVSFKVSKGETIVETGHRVTERAAQIGRVRALARGCAVAYVEMREKLGFPLLKAAEEKAQKKGKKRAA